MLFLKDYTFSFFFRKKTDKKMKLKGDKHEKLLTNILIEGLNLTDQIRIPIILLPVPSDSLQVVQKKLKLQTIRPKSTEIITTVQRSISSAKESIPPKDNVHLMDHGYPVNSGSDDSNRESTLKDAFHNDNSQRDKIVEKDVVMAETPTTKFLNSGIQTTISVPPNKKKNNNSTAQTQTSGDIILKQAMASANIQIESTSVGTQVTPKDKQKSVDIQTQVTLRSKNRKRGRSVQNPKKKGGTVIGRKKLYGNSSSESAMQTTTLLTEGTQSSCNDTNNTDNCFTNNIFRTIASTFSSNEYFQYNQRPSYISTASTYAQTLTTGYSNSKNNIVSVVFPDTHNEMISMGSQFPKSSNEMISTGSQFPNIQNEMISFGSQFPNSPNEMVSTESQFPNSQNEMISTGSQFPNIQNEMVSTGSQFPNSQNEMISTGSQFPNIQNEMVSTGSQFPNSQNEMISIGSQFSNIQNEMMSTESQFPNSTNELISTRSRFVNIQTEDISSGSQFSNIQNSSNSISTSMNDLYCSQTIGVQTYTGDFQDFLLSQSDLSNNSTNSIGINTDKSSGQNYTTKEKLLRNKCVGNDTAYCADSVVQTVDFDFLASSPDPQAEVMNIQTQTGDLDIESLESLVSSMETQTGSDYNELSSLDVQTQTVNRSSVNTQTLLNPSMDFDSYPSSNIETQTYDEFPGFIELLSSGTQTLDYGFFQDAPLSLINIETQTGMNELIENHSKFNFGTQTSVIDKTNINVSGSNDEYYSSDTNNDNYVRHQSTSTNNISSNELNVRFHGHSSEQMEFLVSEVLEMIPVETESAAADTCIISTRLQSKSLNGNRNRTACSTSPLDSTYRSKYNECNNSAISTSTDEVADEQTVVEKCDTESVECNYEVKALSRNTTDNNMASADTQTDAITTISSQTKTKLVPYSKAEEGLEIVDSLSVNNFTQTFNNMNNMDGTTRTGSPKYFINNTDSHTQTGSGVVLEVNVSNTDSHSQTGSGLSNADNHTQTGSLLGNADNHTQTGSVLSNVDNHTQAGSVLCNTDSHTQTGSGLGNAVSQTQAGSVLVNTDSHTQTGSVLSNVDNHTQAGSGLVMENPVSNIDNHTQTGSGLSTLDLTNSQTQAILQSQIMNMDLTDSHTQTILPSPIVNMDLTDSHTQTILQSQIGNMDLTDSHTQTTWQELNDLLTELDH